MTAVSRFNIFGLPGHPFTHNGEEEEGAAALPQMISINARNQENGPYHSSSSSLPLVTIKDNN